jgi:hypothetical protein
MKKWLQGGLIAGLNAGADSFLLYLSLNVAAPESLANPQILKGLAVFVGLNVAKTLAHYFKNPPVSAAENAGK